MTGKPFILSTKVISDTHREMLHSNGIEWIEKDFISIQFTQASLLSVKSCTVVLITSKNAVRSLIQFNQTATLKGKVIYCVGESIEKLLKGHQITVTQSFENALQMGLFMISQKENNISILCGNRSRPELPNILNDHHISFTQEITYISELTPTKRTENFNAILFFCPSAVESYISKNAIKQEKIICIGQTTLASIQPYSKNIYVADNHRISSVIQKTIDLFQNT